MEHDKRIMEQRISGNMTLMANLCVTVCLTFYQGKMPDKEIHNVGVYVTLDNSIAW